MPPVVDFIVLLYDSVLQRPLDSFKDDAMAALKAAIPFDSAAWGSGAHRDNIIVSMATDSIQPEALLDYALNWQSQDMLRAAVVAASGQALRNHDIMSDATHRDSAIYRSYCAPNGMDQAMGCALADTVTTVGELIMLFRRKTSSPFSDSERDFFQAVAPHLFASWRQRQSLGLWSRQSSGSPQPLTGYAVIDNGGLIHAADGDFGKAVLRACPDWAGPVLPEPLRALIGRGRSPIRLDGQHFALRRGGDGRHLLLALGQEAEALTPAERRAARLFAGGATHAAIAAELGLSSATVRNQLAAVYRKLNVHSKLALAAALAAIPD